ncbi:protein of unknown function [Neorhodopirellula lusitana]|uniref:3-keto-alpha-glucoside-1,2-lyase/3-keto-2-hydroxy-glucal hydratase domain-containing protein n=1 Tax=Neorhodopirellula lusitana TaxID=445327 RepID=A0ABY1Q300_9BACT|nr:DUF1080 domain-containing protein [Neorhodopirellula lusitana]SMP53179.1 protein of unknown function [Neorhodopirellula lusitana]
MPIQRSIKLVMFAALVFAPFMVVNAEEYQSGIQWKEPKVVTPGETSSDPPSDAVILFREPGDLKNWKNSEKWTVEDGVMVAGKGTIASKEVFGDCQVHVEWSSPDGGNRKGQQRSNSGIFLMGIYELQVLDSYQNKTYFDGQAGAIYKQTPPAVNAMRPPGEWNTYDIFWTAPRFDESGELLSPAYITAVHNGVLILNHFELKGDTPYARPPAYKAHAPMGPIKIQDHGNPVRFRNIWARHFQSAQVDTAE